MITILNAHPTFSYFATVENNYLHQDHGILIEGACVNNTSITRKYFCTQLNFNTMDLIICACLKNKNISLLQELRDYHVDFKEHMHLHNDRFLDFVCTGHAFQPDNPEIRTTKFRPTAEDCNFLEMLINSGCFNSTKRLIVCYEKQNTKDENLHAFDEVLEVLNKKDRYCSIQ